jgi:aldehyde dehydrogenase
MATREQLVTEIAQEVIARLQLHMNGGTAPAPAAAAAKGSAPAGDGVFATIDEAVRAAAAAQVKVAAMSLEERDRMIRVIRRICTERADELGRMELAETKIGRLDHKIAKLQAMRLVVGVEAIKNEARTDGTGVCLIERAPWGVIGMILPATHSVPTMVSNAINILAAGNAAVFNAHPAGAKVAAYALQLFNREIVRETGVANAITCVAQPTIETAEALFKHKDVPLLCITGGPAVVRAAMQSGKRVIAGGPGNPPVVVDETANLDLAARSVIQGAAFDNNLLCIGEKEVFVVASVADAFKGAMRVAGAHELDKAAIERLTKAAFDFEPGSGKGCARAHVKKEMVGRDVAVLAQAAGVRVPAAVELLFGETDENHPFVVEEQMMPFVPIVRVPDVDAAIAASVRAEHGYKHTAVIHSQKLENVSKMARAMNTTLFVHNAPSTGALGVGGAGYFSHTVATPTGEGVTTPLSFTRERQIVSGAGALRII